jgi:hypothetical protein
MMSTVVRFVYYFLSCKPPSTASVLSLKSIELLGYGLLLDGWMLQYQYIQ